jgi:hypothetical protein
LLFLIRNQSCRRNSCVQYNLGKIKQTYNVLPAYLGICTYYFARILSENRGKNTGIFPFIIKRKHFLISIEIFCISWYLYSIYYACSYLFFIIDKLVSCKSKNDSRWVPIYDSGLSRAGLTLRQNKHVLRASRRKGTVPHKSGHEVIYFISQVLCSKTHQKSHKM